MLKRIIIVIVIAPILSAQAFATPQDFELGPLPRGKAAMEEYQKRAWAMADEVPALIASNKREDNEIAKIKTKALLRSRLKYVVNRDNKIIKSYLEKKNFEIINELVDYALLQHPESTIEVGELLKMKVAALLQLGKAEEALATAKVYYNMAPINDTNDAIRLVMTTVLAARPGSAAVAEQFKKQQIEGAALVVSRPLEDKTQRSGLLAEIAVQPEKIGPALSAITGQDYSSLVKRASLLLLADRPEEAEAAYYAAFLIATDKNITDAAENVSRAMRAADGNVGRANSWIDSLRSTTPAN